MVRQAQAYHTLQDALRRAGALGEASEVHGSLCAVLCVGGSAATAVWRQDSLDNVDESNAQVPAARTALQHLELETWAALNGSAMDFMPLLPNDSDPLEQRVDALAHWCQGFLYGVTLSGVTVTAANSGGAAHLEEFLRDLAEIARAGLGADDDAVEADFAYAELVEFVRAGVQLLFEELDDLRGRSGSCERVLH